MDQARRDSLQSLIRRLGLEDLDSPSLLLEVERAMTHTSSGRTDHNERLEFLGDAVLRLAATLYLDRHHHGLTVGDSSSLRAQLVSDRWLAELGDTIDIESCLILGVKAMGRRQHVSTGALPVGGKPIKDWLKAAACSVEGSDQCFGGISANRPSSSCIIQRFGPEDQAGLDVDRFPQLRQPAITHQLGAKA